MSSGCAFRISYYWRSRWAFAYPYVVLRTARFIARHVEFHGDIRTAAIGQTEVKAPRYGEGLMEFFGIGMI